MIDKNIIIVKDKFGKELQLSLKSLLVSSFYLHWEQNSTYEIQFTAIDDSSLAYALLQTENTLEFMGQEYVIKQATTDNNVGTANKAIVATHIFNECKWFRKREIKSGVLTYTPQSIMQYVFDGNQSGFTYEVVGNFAGNQIENFGNVSGLDALNKIIEVWPDAILYPNNKHIVIYQHDSFVKNHGRRLGYLQNSSEIKLTEDSTNLINQVWCIGKEQDKPDGADANTPPTYYFPPFLVSDADSIAKYGVHEAPTISDDRFTDANSMKQYAMSEFNLDPNLTIEVTKKEIGQPIPGEVIRLEILKENFVTNVEVVGFQWYPISKETASTVTLNNTVKTIFDYQNSLMRRQYNSVLQNQLAFSRLVNKQFDLTDQELKDLKNKIKDLQPGTWNPGSLFIDTSSNNGDISDDQFRSYAANGVKGIICKLTESVGYTNPYFVQHKTNATNVGLKFIGAYHLFHGNPVAEANHFIDQLKSNNISTNTLVICDIEDTEASKLTTDKNLLTSQLQQFYKVLADAGYTNTCDYASSSWFGSRFNSVANYKWSASYGSNNRPDNCDAWQFTENWNGQHLDCSYSYNPVFV